ncbi:hypothetical protein VOLCADRAFT_119720 [Volvox carteri f. nagariensis]|uniref:Cupin type-2 domain-containing protein n=1 Tax=Volvox carteri f. nagariensis TaxID=3068 RepID=D8UFM0_VOLCA|nr:uncharacterized protein VOLCADRAFT_119720 [Volvox carteri f. nagariensis]EFJ41482.1 hypothetical protein VOLCADRAFT_119720 [Volvox carteri f. nagariensis]|eukprot:XP_002957427.1 hypothetical protein VOLCADRAFT_119720 [Volvox carteri f. nagariensis]
MLQLSINPGHGWPPHRHFEADEWLYVLSGSGAYSYWAFEEISPVEIIVGPGHALFNPQGQLHQVWNNGSEPLLLLAVSKSLAPYEVLDHWPDTPGGGLGYVPHVAPWELSCAPGHEPDENDGVMGEQVGSGMEEAEVGYLEGTPLEESEAGSGLEGDYGHFGEYGSCGMTAMSEGEIAECMAEPDMGYDFEEEYDVGMYDGEGADEEPEFPSDGEAAVNTAAAEVEDTAPGHYEFGEL